MGLSGLAVKGCTCLYKEQEEWGNNTQGRMPWACQAVRGVLTLDIFVVENQGGHVAGGGHGSCTFP